MTINAAGSNSVSLARVNHHGLKSVGSASLNINPNFHTANSQCGMILSHLQKGHRLTAIGALALFGCARLAARIDNLKNDGWPIISESIKVVNRDGKTVRVAEYWLDLEAV